MHFSATELRATLPHFLPKTEEDAEPYELNLADPNVRKLLGENPLPNVIKIQATSQTPDRTKWLQGECKKGNDAAFESALTRHDDREMPYYAFSGVYTPVTLLKTATHDVYGQFFHNQTHNFKFACIRGFDKNYYIVHGVFQRIFTYQYNCYGLPAADYERIWCEKCQAIQIRQVFQKTCDLSRVVLYAYPNCSAGGSHSFIKRLQTFDKCGVQDDKLPVGAEL